MAKSRAVRIVGSTFPAALGTRSRLPSSAFIRNLIASYGFYFSGYLLSFLVVPFLARVLGPSHWGVFALTQTIGMYLILIVDCGFALSATKVVARNRDNREALAVVLADVWSAKVMLALMGVGFAIVAGWLTPALRDQPRLLWSGVVWGILQGANLNWYFQGLEQMSAAATVDISIKSAAVLLTFVVVRAPEDAWLALALNASACLVSLVVLSLRAYTHIPFRLTTFRSAVTCLRNAVQAFWPRNSFIVSSLSGVFILGFFAPPVVVGNYAGAERITRAVMGLLVPLADALYSRINRVMATAPDAFYSFGKRVILLMAACGVTMGVVVFFGAPLLVRMFLGGRFGAAVPILQMFAFLAPVIAIGNALGTHWMLSLGLDRAFARISLASAVFALVATTAVASTGSVVGTAGILVSSQVLLTVSAYISLRRHRGRVGAVAPPAGAEPVIDHRERRCSPEWQLVLTAARLELDPQTGENVARLARLPLDWKLVVAIAQEHCVLPLVHRTLCATVADSLPRDIRSEMEREAFAIASRNLILSRELSRVVGVLHTAGIPVIPFKGPVLAEFAYGNIALRPFGDLDILVQPHDVAAARAALMSAGYEAEFGEDARETKYIHRAERVVRFVRRPAAGGHRASPVVVIEMHWEFAPRNMGYPQLAGPDLWARRREHATAAGSMSVLSAEDNILQLCFHGAKHCWDKLEWIASLSELVRSGRTLDWDFITDAARRRSSERILHVGLALVRRHLGELPTHAPSDLDPEAEALAELVLRNLVSMGRDETRKARYRYWFYLKARERWIDRVRTLYAASGQTLRPRQLERSRRTTRLGMLMMSGDRPGDFGATS